MLIECPVCGGSYYHLYFIYSGELICPECGEWFLSIAETFVRCGGVR